MDKLREKFGFKVKDKPNNIVNNVVRVPIKDHGVNIPMTNVFKKNNTHQIDLLYMPHDRGYKYIVVIVDLATRLVGAMAVKSKTSKAVLEAVKSIYSKSKYLEQPIFIEVDAGAEFKDEFKKYFVDKGVVIKYKRTGRHRSQAVVEATNGVIGNALNNMMLATELETNEVSTEWVDDLNDLIRLINSDRVKKTLLRNKRAEMDEPVCNGDSCKLLNVGDKVRVILDEPRNIENKKLHGRFRMGDIRWEIEPRTITQVVLNPSQPPMYLVSGIKNASYTKNQLQLVKDGEAKPPQSAIKKYVVEKLLEKRNNKGRVQYLVKWQGYKNSDSTWEYKNNIPPQFIKEFETT